jgi:hypothetical protein
VLFNASGDVINGTNATVADGVLAIQLAHGFETHLVGRGLTGIWALFGS